MEQHYPQQQQQQQQRRHPSSRKWCSCGNAEEAQVVRRAAVGDARGRLWLNSLRTGPTE